MAEYSVNDDLWAEGAANLIGALGPGISGSGSAADALRVDRLSVNWASPIGDLAVGRQAWGHGAARVFPITDLVRPFSPASVDTEFKQGVDMLRWSRPLGESFELEALGIHDAPVDDPDRGWGGLGRARILLAALEADVSIVAGALPRTRPAGVSGQQPAAQPLAGLAAAGDLLGAGWVLEGLWRDGDTAATAGLSRMFPGRFTLTAEALFNDGAYPLLPGRWWSSGVATLEVTPLINADIGALVPLSDDVPPGVDELLFGGVTASVSDESTVRLGWVDTAFYADVRSAF